MSGRRILAAAAIAATAVTCAPVGPVSAAVSVCSLTKNYAANPDYGRATCHQGAGYFQAGAFCRNNAGTQTVTRSGQRVYRRATDGPKTSTVYCPTSHPNITMVTWQPS